MDTAQSSLSTAHTSSGTDVQSDPILSHFSELDALLKNYKHENYSTMQLLQTKRSLVLREEREAQITLSAALFSESKVKEVKSELAAAKVESAKIYSDMQAQLAVS